MTDKLPPISAQVLKMLQDLRSDFPLYAEKALKIRSKSGAIVPLKLNSAQLYLHQKLEEQLRRTGKVRALVLKGRQQGVSTYIEARFFWKTVTNVGIQTFILTHEDSATANLFEMARRYLDYLPRELSPTVETQNAKELTFRELNSGYKLGTAGNKSTGRSSTVQLFHGSEIGFWPNAEEHAAGVMQAVPSSESSEVVLESTANGLGNFFHTLWQRAERGDGDFIAVFIPWYWQDEYQVTPQADFSLTPEETAYAEAYGLSDQKMAWRRSKIVELGEVKFKQEYPANAIEAFQSSGEDSLIQPEVVLKARKTRISPSGPLLLGVDPARFGDDRTSIIRRQGRVAFDVQSYHGKDTMEVAGLVAQIIKKEQPVRVFVDVGGLGAGVVDRLRELGFARIVEAVNFGSKAIDEDRYRNKRAECWALMKNWLDEEPCQIPDSDTLHSDLITPRFKFDSSSRLQLEDKDSIRRRGLVSPDEADALSLTFASPVASLEMRTADPYAGFRRGSSGLSRDPYAGFRGHI